MKQQVLYHQSRNKIPIQCKACGKMIEKGQQKLMHHTSYFPEVKVHVHKSCHAKIHWGTDYQHLMPNPSQTQRFYRTILTNDVRFNNNIMTKGFSTVVPQFFNQIEKIEMYFKKINRNSFTFNGMTKHIVECVNGHQIVTKKLSGEIIKCYTCGGKRFEA